MRKTDDKPNALKAATAPGLLENLQTINIQMDKIQRLLEVIDKFLFEKKTKKLFYFLLIINKGLF